MISNMGKAQSHKGNRKSCGVPLCLGPSKPVDVGRLRQRIGTKIVLLVPDDGPDPVYRALKKQGWTKISAKESGKPCFDADYVTTMQGECLTCGLFFWFL